MATTVLPIRSIERRMRGGSQALLVRDQAGNAYIAKCVSNPQGTRTLINEWIISRLLRHLRVSTPAVSAIRIERGIPGDSLLEFQVGNRRIPIASGIHLGTPCPVDPDRRAIFDFLPRRLLHKVVNLPDLFLSFVFDKWVNQTDSRQAIFIRERSAGRDVKFRTYLIDHGLSFGGSRWELSENAFSGLFHDRSVYDDPRLETECQAAIARIQQLPEKSFFSIEEEIPPEWLEPGDREDMTRLLELLSGRRTKLQGVVDRALRQLHETGIVPKTVEGRALLGSLLLLACLPRSLPPTATSAGIEVTQTQNVAMTQQVERGGLHLVTRFDFAPQSGPKGLGHSYGVQIWRTGTEASRLDGYFFRIYDGKADPGQRRLLGEYGVLLNE
ncbi:MAG: hypothetical protein ACRD4O_07990 [Bryobacteraceae bacterium]